MIYDLPLDFVLDHWRPGSFDRTWEDEFADRGSPERIGEGRLRTWDSDGKPHDELVLQMLRGEPIEPITLGWDAGWFGGRKWYGRVWAGHYRLFIFHTVGRLTIPADVVPYDERRPFPASHCAPPEGVL
jgi:hypothetical protein